MSDRPRIEVDANAKRDLRKLARALLLLAEQKAKEKKTSKSQPKKARP